MSIHSGARAPRSSLYALPLLPLALAACSDRSSAEPQGPVEVFENASGSLEEADLRASIHGDLAEIIFPIAKLEAGTMSGAISARLVDISKKEEPEVAAAHAQITQRDDRASHVLMLSGLPAGLSRSDTAKMVIVWSAALPRGELRGMKSLYAALGKLEVQLKGSTDIPESGSVPLRVLVRDPDTLLPRAGAEVIGMLEPAEEGGSPVQLFAGSTNADGELLEQLMLPAGIEEGSIRVEVREGTTTAWVRTNARIVRDRRLALSTDKTIYKPGQTIELRTLALDGRDKSPIAGREVTFEALDGKGNKVFKRRTTTDEFGVASMKVPTDTAVNEGTWTFRALLDGLKTERKLPVARYNLPKMKIEVATEREWVQPGGEVRGTVAARYLFGLPVAGAAVNVQLLAENGGVIASQQTETDTEGQASFAINVPQGFGGQLDDQPLAISAIAEVVDSAGQREIGAASLPLASAELVIKGLAEAGALIPGIENIVYLLVSDPVGRPLVATLDVDGVGPLAPLTTDADGVAELRFTPAREVEEVRLTINATDGANRTHRRELTLATKPEGAIVIRTDKAVYRAGDTATVQLFATGPVARAYLDVFAGAEGVESRTIELAGGAAETMISIRESMKGVLLFDAFALAGSGTLIRGAQRALVDPQDRLDITMIAEKAEYLPGEEARITINVRDAAGAPQVASLGMTAVDEAVFALGGEPNDDIRALMNLDARVLPADLRVLGRSPAELFSARDASEEERFARLLFASARNVPAPGVDYNTIREELPQVRSAIEGAIRRDAIRFLKTLIPAVREVGSLDEMKARVLVEAPAKRLTDPFGQLYAAKLGDNGNWYMLTLRSAGPDEVLDTADDVSTEIYWTFIQWADEKDFDEDGNWVGGGRGGVDDFAGEAAPNAGQQPAPPPMAPADPTSGGGGMSAVKARRDFRETVYVNPTLITDASGRASISFPLADSITTWRISAQGSTQLGKLGAARTSLRTFQDFFIDFDVPTTLTRGDTIELPAVVYNYLSVPATVEVSLQPAEWMTIVSGASQSISLAPSEVRSVKFTVRAERAGNFALELRGSAGQIADALVREARVLPDGAPEDQSFSDKLNGQVTHTITVPPDAIEGGTRVVLTLTPGFASEAVTGTEALLKEPGGCFEQTTSTAWPNTLVATYLDVTGQMTPELRESAIGYVTRGYQRLLTFESPTGGFNWWGDSDPGNRILSSIMLWHLKDMEGIIETDPAVRDRTLTWLLAQQRADGSWESGDALHSGNEVLGTSDIRTTAFIAWALAHTGWADSAVQRAGAWLAANEAGEDDIYENALAANALAMIDPSGSAASRVFARLDLLKVEGEGRVKWPTETPSWTGTSGDVAAIETTGLVAYALLKADAYPQNAAGAVSYIVANKDAVGSWYNTQATMNALRALLAAASPRGSEAEGTLSVSVNGVALDPVAITREDGDVYRQIDLTGFVAGGDNTITIDMQGEGELTYLLSRRAYRPRQDPQPSSELALSVAFDRTSATIGTPIAVQVHATYTGVGMRDQVMVRIGRAPGFVPRADELEQIVASGRASRFEVNERDVTFYVMGMQSNIARDLSFHYTPTLAIEAEAPASVMYAYYEPAIRVESAPVSMTIAP